MVIRTQREPDSVFLTLRGELDLASAPLLEQQLRHADATDSSQVSVDLSGLEFIDSTGLHTLVSAERRFAEKGKRFSVRRGPPAVHRFFELTNTVPVFQFAD
jgi:anti-sigma B factor antagonist